MKYNSLKNLGRSFLFVGGLGLVGILGGNIMPVNAQDDKYKFEGFGEITLKPNEGYWFDSDSVNMEMSDVDGDGDKDLIIGFKEKSNFNKDAYYRIFIYENNISQKK